MAAPRLTKRDTVLLYALLTAALCYGYYALIVAPRVLTMKAERARTAVLRTDLVRAKLSANELRNWMSATEKARQQCSELPLPESDSLAGFVRYISGQAKEAGVTVTALTPQPPLPENEFSRVSFNIAFKGSFPRVLDFLTALRDGEQIFVVNDAKIDPLVDTESTQISVSLTGFTLLKKLEVTLNAVPQPQG